MISSVQNDRVDNNSQFLYWNISIENKIKVLVIIRKEIDIDVALVPRILVNISTPFLRRDVKLEAFQNI